MVWNFFCSKPTVCHGHEGTDGPVCPCLVPPQDTMSAPQGLAASAMSQQGRSPAPHVPPCQAHIPAQPPPVPDPGGARCPWLGLPRCPPAALHLAGVGTVAPGRSQPHSFGVPPPPLHATVLSISNYVSSWLQTTAWGSGAQPEKTALEKEAPHLISSHQVQQIGANSLNPNAAVYFPELGELFIQIIIFQSCLYGCAKPSQVAPSLLSRSVCKTWKLDVLGAGSWASPSAATVNSQICSFTIGFERFLGKHASQFLFLNSYLSLVIPLFFFPTNIVKYKLNVLYLKHAFLNTESDG